MRSPLASELLLALIAALVPSAEAWQTEAEVSAWSLVNHAPATSARDVLYGLSDGLPDLNVIALEAGPDGRLWIATPAGLTIFDGVKFAPPRHRMEAPGVDVSDAAPAADRPQGLANEYVYALHRDRRNRVWASTEQGSLRYYEGDRVVDLGTSKLLSWAPYLAETRDGAIWAGGKGLVRVTGEGITQITRPDQGPSPIWVSLAVPGSPVMRAAGPAASAAGAGKIESEFDDSEIWLASNAGVYRWTSSTGLAQLDKKPCTGMFFDSGGRRWTLRKDAVELNGTRVACPELDLSQRLITTVSIDEDRTLAVLDGHSLLCEFKDGRPSVSRFGDFYAYTAAFAGDNGSLWLGEGSGGLRFVSPKGFTEIPVPYAGQLVYGVRSAADGRVAFCASTSTGLWTARPTRANPAGAPIEQLAIQPGEKCPPLLGIFDAILDAGGRGWLATRSGIVGVEDGTATRLSEHNATSRAKGQVVRMSSGSLWATDGDRLAEFTDQATGRSIPLVHPILSALVEDGEDILAFHSEQIVRYSTAGLSSSVEVELPGTLFGSLHLAKNGDLWIGTDGNGIYRRQVDGSLDHWSEAEGLPTRYLNWIGSVPGPTESTHLWAGSTKGVMALPFQSLDAVADGRAELLTYGLVETGPVLGGAGAALDNGLLVIPTIHGPVSLDTHAPVEIAEPPSVSIGEVWVNDRLVDSETSFVGATSMTFEYCASQFPFRPTSIVEYQLEDHDEDWIRAGRDRRVRYAGLPPGRYRFRVRARSAGSYFGPIAASTQLSVRPHWYQRGLVRLGALVMVMGSVAAFFRTRTRRLLQQRSLLEAEVSLRRRAEEELLAAQAKESEFRRHLARAEEAERSRIARELHDDLSQRLAAVSMGLHTTSSELKGTILKHQEAALKESVDVIESLASDVHVLSRQLHPAVLDDLGLPAALRSECQRRRSRMSATVTLDESEAPKAVEGEVGLALFRVAQEALQNASRHSGAHHIRITLGTVESRVVLTIQDDGRGFDPEELQRRGLGLASMRERMKLVGGELSITSSAEGGTTVVASAELSLPRATLTPQIPAAQESGQKDSHASSPPA